MAYVVTRLCRDRRDTSCVNVCPVDCFYVPKEVTDKHPNQLFISPSECIDCGACEPECPWEAIFEADATPEPFKEPDTALNLLCDDERDSFETAAHEEKPRPSAEEIAENKKKWGL
jgi:ferredoxin